MSQPAVTINVLDGALGILPTGNKPLAVTGPCTKGALNTPVGFGRVSDLVAMFGYGPAIEGASDYIQRGSQVLFCRAAATTAGANGTLDNSGVTGTSVITADGAVTPIDDFDVVFLVDVGGTIGTAGIVFRYSLDGGNSYSPQVSLGTANTYTIANSGVKINFAAGTLVANDASNWRTTAPKSSNTDIASALTALQQSTVAWDQCLIATEIGSSVFDAIDTAFAAMNLAGKPTWWIGNCALPTKAQTEATYKTAMDAIFATRSSLYGTLCYGDVEMISAVSGRKYRRPVAFRAASIEAGLSEEQNSANLNLGSIGVSIRDDNGNPKHHDESVNPGADDSRYYVLRTVPGVQGVYVNRPRIFSPAGSDFYLIPHRRVMNLAINALNVYFARRLNNPILVNSKTGYILESEALEIEKGAEQILRSVLLAKPKASGIQFALSRTDNLLSTKTLTGDARVIPLAYSEFINIAVGFLNPALQIQKV